MFKKAFKVSSNNNLSGKDRKKLIKDLIKYYDPDSVNTLLDSNANIVVSKVQGSKMVIYTSSDVPILIDESNKGDYFPTVYAYQQLPNLSKSLEINSGVESFLLSGANLMWPGVKNIKNIGDFKKDDVRYVKTSNDIVVAVGMMACSSQELATKGATGQAMIILHVIEDKLWASGPKQILPPLAIEAKGEAPGSVNKEEEKTEEKPDGRPEEKEEVKLDEVQNKKKEEGSGEEDNEEEKDENQVPVEVMDEYLMEAFLTSLKISVNDKDLPIDAGEYYSNHLLPCKREGIFIDVKKSSYKKIGKFLQAMSKLNIIDFKEVKKGGVPQITKINKLNPKLKDFEPVVTKVAKKEVKEEEVSEDDKWPKVIVTEFFKLKPQLYQFFTDEFIGDMKEKFYTREDVHSAMQKYITANNLADKRLVKLDERMIPLFWDEKAERPQSLPPFTMLRDELFKKFDHYLQHYYRITDLRTGEEENKQGAFKGVTLVAEKSHNKNITRINGLEPYQFNVTSLVNKFQLKFACSVSTHTFKEKTQDKTEVTVHGNFIDALVNYFVDECKIERKHIHATNKLEKKKKQ